MAGLCRHRSVQRPAWVAAVGRVPMVSLSYDVRNAAVELQGRQYFDQCSFVLLRGCRGARCPGW